MNSEFKMLVNGNLLTSESFFPVINPSDERLLSYCPQITESVAEFAINSAETAFQTWRKTSYSYRKTLLEKAYEFFKKEMYTLANILCLEQGKILKDANSEIKECFTLFEKNMELITDDHTDTYKGTKEFTVYTKRVPLGVCALITPWNYPVFCAIQKICPALMTGNTVILKPSPFTPLSSLFLGQIFKDIFPQGVFNVVTGLDKGDFKLGEYLTNHKKISKISFTGSTRTGRYIMKAATSNFKRITLEMGGNDAAIIRQDVNVEETARKVFDSAFANTGALCCAIKRVYVNEAIFDAFVHEISRIADGTVMGDGFAEGVEYGPVNNSMQFEKGKALFTDACVNGAKVNAGGVEIGNNGYFFRPTILTNVTDDMRIVKEEQFFPVLPVLAYKTDKEAVERANNTEYGLGGSVWSSNVKLATEMANELRVGTSWVNTHSALTGGEFGGRVGLSGFGRELGKADLYAFTESQTFMIPRKEFLCTNQKMSEV